MVTRFDALAALPLAWEQTAAQFIAAANYLVRIYRDPGPERWTWRSSGTNWPVLLLYATAVENLLKAVLIAQGVPAVSKGHLHRYLGTHHLADYARDAKLILGESEDHLLGKLQDVLEAGKYPVAKQSGRNADAWSFEYPADVKAVWALLRRLENTLRTSGVGCLPRYDPAKLLPAQAVTRRRTSGCS